jgi:hypothetical protein
MLVLNVESCACRDRTVETSPRTTPSVDCLAFQAQNHSMKYLDIDRASNQKARMPNQKEIGLNDLTPISRSFCSMDVTRSGADVPAIIVPDLVIRADVIQNFSNPAERNFCRI